MEVGRLALAAGALALGLAACSGGSSGPEAPASPAAASAVDNGANLYSQNCLPCHREDGKGVPSVYPSLVQSPVVNGDPTQLAQWVLSGRRPASMPPGRYSTQMLQFAWMKDQDAAAVLSYIRSHFGNSAQPVDAAAVAAARP
jgi:mono/diheme cytochrome c family protein